ncbi:MAG: type II toxin-antitoxin system death-on-curing family toxin [Planctomycetaceae bacterium]|nr:type II toxin-antitoxin system death-on-curing family toxin [Planctomycetaceae bacterium]
MPHFLPLQRVLQIHESQIKLFGGSTGIRDLGLLESALAMPQASFGGAYLHSGSFAMAAAYLFHIVSNHPFLDGNKRTGTAVALFFLTLNGIEHDFDIDVLTSLVLSVACGEIGKDKIAAFFRKHCRPK